MSGRYLIVVPVTKAYVLECEVLLKSLCVNNPDIPVHLITREGEAEVGLLRKYGVVKHIHVEPPCDSEFRQVRTSRFRYAAYQKENFDVVALLDADMCCLRTLKNVFRMAEMGTILVGSNNTIFRYIKKDFDYMNISAPADINHVHGSFCTVPLFINPTIHSNFLQAVWNSPTGNDLDVPNLLSVSMGLSDQLYYLASFLFLNIHHSMIKPETGVKSTEQGLFSLQGEPLYMLHGHWGDPNYVEELIEPMIKNYGYHPPYIDTARNSINILKKEYDKYATMEVA